MKIKITESQANKLKNVIKEDTFSHNFMDTLINDSELTYEYNEDPDGMKFDMAEGIFAFTTDYNEDHPFIHFLKNLLNEWMYQPSMGAGEGSLEYYGRVFYETLVDNEEIYKQKFN